MLRREQFVSCWIIAVSLLTASMATAEESFSTIFDRLAKVEIFAFGPVGYAGRISQGEKDFRSILARSSVVDFEKLYRTGNIQAKFYALIGIRKLSPERYDEFARPLRTSKEEVETAHGCIVGKEPVADVIKQIDATNMSLIPYSGSLPSSKSAKPGAGQRTPT